MYGLNCQEVYLNVNFILVFSASSMQQTAINNVNYTGGMDKTSGECSLC